MIISHEKELIFIHIPRTAGTRISKSICRCIGVDNWRAFIGEPKNLVDAETEERREWIGEKHIGAIDLKSKVSEEVWESYFKFAFVRNPWDRAISVYLHSIKSSNNLISTIWPKNNHLFNLSLILKYEFLGMKPVQQKDYICNENGDLMVDFVGKFENLKRDFFRVCDRLGVECRLGGKYDATGSRNYREWYTNKSKVIIDRVKSDDIEMFDYNF
jgi:hypothetical protein